MGTSKGPHVPSGQRRKTDFKQIIADVIDIKRKMLQKFMAKEFSLGQSRSKQLYSIKEVMV